MDEDELNSMQVMSGAIATMALQNAVDAVNAVFGPGNAKIDTPLVAAVFTAQSQFISNLITAASNVDGEEGLFDSLDLDDDDDDFDLNS